MCVSLFTSASLSPGIYFALPPRTTTVCYCCGCWMEQLLNRVAADEAPCSRPAVAAQFF
ncbi:hypothetical protein SESBI_12897 [Sesbania bispinosa]|nr:hypothetical protein SESBI_12897 [Sesbania bispinosa]